MRTETRVFLVAAVMAAAMVVACGGGATGGGGEGPGACVTAAQCDGGLCVDGRCLGGGGDLGPGEDVAGEAAHDPGPAPDAGDDARDTAPEIVEGGFGWPCTLNTDCEYGLCLPTLNGSVCTVPCLDECPDPTWVCEYVSPPGMDPLYACVPPWTSLCRPCTADTDCDLVPGEEARCVVYGPAGRFCGVACEDDCPEGFSCADLLTASGEGVRACVADAGDCPCLLGFVGLATQCFLHNDAGTCLGQRLCTKAGDGVAWLPCDAATPAVETCNGLDDDCDGVPDGGLGTVPCGTGVCARELPACDKGQPVTCDPFAGATAEKCNALDDDCDGDTDEMWPDKGAPCDGPDPDFCENGVLGCSDQGDTLVCMHDDVNFAEVCNGLDDDCDGDTDEVTDLGETTCGLGVCRHTIPNCLGGQPQTCNPMEGVQPDDPPDPEYLDTNCDGIDGDILKAVFVDVATGKDLNPGTPDLPKKTIGAGLEQAVADGKAYVLVSLGVYHEAVTLRDGIGLFGQYDKAAGWSRKPENTTQVKGGTRGVVADGLWKPTTMQGFFITSDSATNPGESSYGVFARNSPGLSLVGDVIQAGSGASGASGPAGMPGLNGSNGSNGSQGCEYDCQSGYLNCDFTACLFGVCGSCTRPQGGAGGASPCGANGGKGGDGGSSNASGYAGAKGSGTSGGNGGYGGATHANGGPGDPGLGGQPGANGGAGLQFGVAGNDGYAPADGVTGAPGTHGSGGGGGGGGGGDAWDILNCCKTYGSSGGGGGGGGCAGQGGSGGGGGGGSFGVFVVGATIRLEKCTIKTGNGGVGGNGGLGGGGGAGGSNGSGGPKGDDDNQGIGAAGGKGGNGGNGGHGGGGGGGPTIGIACAGGAGVTLDQTSFQLGQPGLGGWSQGNSGVAGLKAETRGCTP